MSGDHGSRLTAWALGEGDAAERAAVEALIARDPAAAAEAEEIRAAAAALEAAFAGEAAPALDPSRRAALERAMAGEGEPAPAPLPVVLAGGARPRPFLGAAAAAALLVTGIGVAGYSVALRDDGVVVAGGRGYVRLGDRDGGPWYRDGVAKGGGGGGGESQVLVIVPHPPTYGQESLSDLPSYGSSNLPLAKGGGASGGGGSGGASYTGTSWAGIGGSGGAARGTAPNLYPSSPSWRVGAAGGGGGGGHQSPGTSHLFGRAGGRGGVGGQGPSLPNYSAVLLDENLRLRLGDSGGIGNGAGVHLVKSAGSITVEGGVGNRTPGYFYFGAAGGGGAGGSIALYAKRPLGIAIGAVVNQADDDVVFFDPATIVRTETGFTFREVSISPDVMVTVTGTLPADILSLKETPPPESTSETFAPLPENPWTRPVGEAALSTFSVDVDTASYSIVRRCLVEQGRLPPRDAVRLEELVNWFDWDYAPPTGADPFAVHLEAAACPWEPAHRLVRVALKGRVVEEAERPAANLVFLLDVSGSMDQPNKLPLVQRSLELLAGRLDARDRVSIVVYAGASGLVLPPTRGDDRAAIRAAVANLRAGGSTNGGAGIELAYRIAEENLIPGGINRVLLATDGDFNVGVTDPAALVSLVEEKAKSKVFLTALGFGMDNLKDATLERLADRGNGNYAYVDDLAEARKVLVEQGMSTLHAIAKDVKIQVEWNPAQVAGYRLLGYENRLLAAQDFADDAKDAGEIGAGHSVTAFYEVVPFGREVPGGAVDGLRYQRPAEGTGSLETLTVKLRWKEPEGEASTLREIPFVDAGGSFDGASGEFRFAAAVAEWALLLRGSRFAGSASLDAVREIAAGALGADGSGRRAEFLRLVEKSAALSK